MLKRFTLLCAVLMSCSSSGTGPESRVSDAAVDATASPQSDAPSALPCSGICGAGTVCMNDVCVAVAGTGGAFGHTGGQGGNGGGLGAGGAAPLGTGGRASTGGSTTIIGSGGSTNMGGMTGAGGLTRSGGASGTGGTMTTSTGGSNAEPSPEPSQDGGVVETGRTCGLIGQPCCSGGVCNVGATCSGQGCVAGNADAGRDTGPEASPPPADTTPACGGENQPCCLTIDKWLELSAKGVDHFSIRMLNCPTSARKGYDCIDRLNPDDTQSTLCLPCAEYGLAGSIDGCVR